MPSIASRLNNPRLRDLVFLVLAWGMALLFLSTTQANGFPLDDSWIHQVYARNLAVLGEWSFIPGVPSAASTSPLYTVLLSIGYQLNIDYVVWTHLLGIMALWFTAMIGARMAKFIASERLPEQADLLAWLTGIALILSWHLVWATVSGMETMLFSMLTLLLMALAWWEMSPAGYPAARGALFGVISALAMLARPEGVMLAGLCGLAVMLRYISKRDLRNALFWALASAVAFGIVVSPYLIYNYQLTGGFLPDTAAAKNAQFAPILAQPYLTRVFSLIVPILVGGQVILLVGAVVYLLDTLRHRERGGLLLWLLPVVWFVALVMLYAARLPADYQHGRYIMPVLPGLIVVGVAGTVLLIAQAQSNAISRLLSRFVAITALVTFIVFIPLGMMTYRTDVNIVNEEMVNTALWISAHVDDDQLLAAHDIGAIGYFAPRRQLIDTAGLLTPELATIYHDGEAQWAYLEEVGADYIVGFLDQLPNDTGEDARLCEVFDTQGATSQSLDHDNMKTYRIDFSGGC